MPKKIDYIIAPCPFCGSAKAPTVTTAQESEQCVHFESAACKCFELDEECEVAHVVCDMTKGGCGASSGYCLSMGEAVSKWNARPEPSEPKEHIENEAKSKEKIDYPNDGDCKKGPWKWGAPKIGACFYVLDSGNNIAATTLKSITYKDDAGNEFAESDIGENVFLTEKGAKKEAKARKTAQAQTFPPEHKKRGRPKKAESGDDA